MSNIEPGDFVRLKGICEDETTLNTCQVLEIKKNNPKFVFESEYTADKFIELIDSRILLALNKEFTVSFKVKSIDSRENGFLIRFNGTTGGDWGAYVVYCIFDNSQRSTVVKYNVGDKMTVKGTFTFNTVYVGALELTKCVILK